MTEAPKQRLLKAQYSLQWIFVEMALTAVALGCLAYFVNSPDVYRPGDVFLPYTGFFIAAGCAVGGFVHRHALGGLGGLTIALWMWPFLLRGIAS